MFGMILELMRIFPDVISAMASAHRQKHQSTQINTIKNTVQPTLRLLASNAGARQGRLPRRFEGRYLAM
jgi:hypothetical protein